MRLTPPSHSAQLERLQWIRAAAAVWESPAVCRAARIWAGAGVAVFIVMLPFWQCLIRTSALSRR